MRAGDQKTVEGVVFTLTKRTDLRTSNITYMWRDNDWNLFPVSDDELRQIEE